MDAHVKQTLQETIWTSVGDRIGKISVFLTASAKTLAFIQVAEINEVFTMIVTGITIVYVTLKALNQLDIFLQNREKNKKPKS